MKSFENGAAHGHGHENGAPSSGTKRAGEKAYLIGVETADLDDDLDLEELQALAEAAGAQVVGSMVQRRRRPHPATFMGRGKLEELALEAKTAGANLLISDNDLSPAQAVNVENQTELRLVDRSQLIMDIFAERAKTHQAKLQVELAQLQYTLPRLKRLWTHLDRYKGGIGMRGPGETQIESDRRIITKKISELKNRLKIFDERKSREVGGRHGFFTVSLVGYTNAGKSTLLNTATDAKVGVANQVFSTLDTRTRAWNTGGGLKVLLSDTVGFIRKLPHHLVASFRATLAEACTADLLIHVIDASHPRAHEHVQAVDNVLRTIGADERPQIIVANKIDQVSNMMDVWAMVNDDRKVIPVSAAVGTGFDALKEAVREHLVQSFRQVLARCTGAASAQLPRMRQHGVLMSTPKALGEDRIEVELQVPPWSLDAVTSWEVNSDVEIIPLDDEGPLT